MNINRGVAVALLLLLCKSLALDSQNIVIIILSQENSLHRRNAELLKENILQQAESLKALFNNQILVKVLPDETTHVGYWTIVPLFPRLIEAYGDSYSWIYFCEDNTVFNLKRLMLSLQKLDNNENLWMGFGLFDEEPTIIHHFAFSENPTTFKYPLISAGFIITTSLLKELKKKKLLNQENKPEFTIDASHELALYIGEFHPLKHSPTLFCDKPSDDCASYPRKIKNCSPTLANNEIYFAVKTCHKFHDNRVPFIQKTWGKEVKYIRFFSDIENKTIPTLQVGIKNTERGHCLKTLQILKIAFDEIKNNLNSIKWLFLADDDTILSSKRLQSHLSCYSSDTVVGERYGYKVQNGLGYNYLTGGGGIAFGLSTLQDIINFCHCPQIDSPDDMVLGLCLAALNLSVTHSPLFHQARPMDYPRSYLGIGDPVSFHKHWNMDPLVVYKKWFLEPTYEAIHSEL